MKIYFLFLLLFEGLLWQTAFSQNQNELAKSFKEDNYKVFKIENGAVVATAKPWAVKVFWAGSQDAQGNPMLEKVEINRAGVILETFKPDLAMHPAYLNTSESRITFLKNYICYYTYAQDHATIKYFLCEDCQVSDYQSINRELDAYILEVFKSQKGSREQQAAVQQKQAEADKIKYSLKDKAVQSVQIVITDTPSELGHFSQISYGVQATLADGQVFKTPNLGGKTAWENFKVEVQGAEFGEEKLKINPDCASIPADQVRIKASSKYHPQISATKNIDLVYNASIDVNYSGGRGGTSGIYVHAGMRGQNGSDLEIYAKPTSHKSNGSSLIQIEVRGGGKILHRFKLSPNTPLNVYANGGNGSYGDKGKSPGNGGNGGNIMLYKDPKCPNLAISVSNRGGNGGKYKDSKITAPNGFNGTFRTINQNVSLNW